MNYLWCVLSCRSICEVGINGTAGARIASLLFSRIRQNHIGDSRENAAYEP